MLALRSLLAPLAVSACLLGACVTSSSSGSSSGAESAPTSDSEGESEAETGEPAPTLRVLSYNIAVGRESDLETLAEVIGSASPDIAGLQELDRFTNRSGPEVDQVAVLGQLTGMQSYFFKTIDWDGGDFGMAVLLADDLTLVDTESEPLPLPEGGEARFAWRLELARSSDPNATFNVLVTHLSPYSSANREAQAQLLVDDALPVPELVLGDLNAGPNSTPLEILATRFSAGPTTGSDQVDYVLHEAEAGWQLQELRVLDAQDHPLAASASDHPAVLAIFKN